MMPAGAGPCRSHDCCEPDIPVVPQPRSPVDKSAAMPSRIVLIYLESRQTKGPIPTLRRILGRPDTFGRAPYAQTERENRVKLSKGFLSQKRKPRVL